jgi:hypothetical protein
MKLAPVVQPLVSRGMTRDELIRAAERAFPQPTLIIEMMIRHLEGTRGEDAISSHPKSAAALHFPACGAQLQLDLEEP